MKTIKTVSICLLSIIALALVSCMQEEKPKEAKQKNQPQNAECFEVKNWLRHKVFMYWEEINNLFDDLNIKPLISELGVVTYDDVLCYIWYDNFSNSYYDNYGELKTIYFDGHRDRICHSLEEYEPYIRLRLGEDKEFNTWNCTYGVWACFNKSCDTRGQKKQKSKEIAQYNESARKVADPAVLIKDVCRLWDLRKQFYESQTMERIQVFEWKLAPVVSENFKEYNVIYELKDDKRKTRYALVNLVEFNDGRYEVKLIKKASVISELYQQ